MSHKVGAKVQQVETLDGSIRDWSGLQVELEQSLLACKLAIDLLENITSSLRVSVQSVQEHSQNSSLMESV